MEWLNNLLGKRKPEPEPKLEATPIEPEQEEPQAPTFTEIGGSPVSGLNLHHGLRGHTKWIDRIA